MRKLLTTLTLAISFLAASGVAGTIAPPTCGDNCPWVHETAKIAPPTCGDNCPWLAPEAKIAPPTCGDNCPWIR